ncbi:prolyl oligopeptidase family serine peptidase [Kribbella deserti]|uniref:prolyl oligopeptidase n=1 Tax=Kribbella deserti TaxID=1926257 RepID=A0ABV6QQU3_9ACTN
MRRSDVVEVLHGHAVADPYRWLEDPRDPDTAAWQADQDERWRAYAAKLPGRYSFRAKVAARTRTGMVSPPVWRGDRHFFLRRRAGQDHPVLYVVHAGVERALVDPMHLDPSGQTTLDHWTPSPNGLLLAYQISCGGDERSTLHMLDVTSGEPADEPIDDCRYSPVAWLPDSRAFYFVRARQVRLHHLGERDDLIVCATEASYGLEISSDGRWLTISAALGSRNDLWLVDLAEPGHHLRAVQVGVDAVSAMTVGPDGRLYVATTQDAPSGRVCVGNPFHPEPEHWQELIAEEPGAPLTELAVLDDVLLVGRSRHALSELGIHDRETGKRLGEVPLPGLGSVGGLTTRPSGGCEAWFSYTDSVTPGAVYRYDARSGVVELWDGTPSPIEGVESHQISFTSKDGTTVRMVVLAKPGTEPRPTILYGYGGFGLSLTPSYSAFTLAWVEAGGVFVTANLRGGGEEGEQWHQAGTREHKQNVIDDFLAAAKTLINEGWTTSRQLALCGESNGGLLVGAAITQRPDLFAAAVCSAPVLDMLRYELSGLGPSWVPEYGTAGDPAQFAHLLAYSPYHRVAAGTAYPAVLFTVFEGDTRVDPMHARKMCAALQEATSSSRPILLRAESGTGHAGGAVSRGVGLAADMLAFLGAHTGLT